MKGARVGWLGGFARELRATVAASFERVSERSSAIAPFSRGLVAAATAPAKLEADGLRALMERPGFQNAGKPAAGRAPRRAVWTSRLALRALGKLPGAPWRDTCLFRAIAECEVLRSYGVPAVLRLGAGPGGGAGAAPRGHAWVEAEGYPVIENDAAGYAAFAPARGRDGAPRGGLKIETRD